MKVPFELRPALLAGFAATVATTALMKTAGAAGMTDMPPMNLIQGAMFTDDEASAKKLGMLTRVGMMGSMHPRMQPAAALQGVGPVQHADHGVRIRRPGLFAHNYGSMTPMGLLAGHALYGLVAAWVYSATAL